MAPQETAKFRTAFLVNFLPVSGRTASPIMHRFGWCFSEDWMCFTTHRTFRNYVSRWRHKIRKLAVEIFQNVKQSTAELCQILCIVTIYIVINYARDNILPVCIVSIFATWDYAFVSSCSLFSDRYLPSAPKVSSKNFSYFLIFFNNYRQS